MNDMPKISNKVTEENFSKLKEKLRELFQLDRGDLDFGLYRIMAHKSAEVEEFLEQHLLPQVAEALGEIANADREGAEQELAAALVLVKKVGGIDPEQTDVVKDARAKLRIAKTYQQIEADTYNHLCNFFSRYYDEGDFMSLRRYKGAGGETYSIPYNGEEIKLHWANADQYYIKTTENYCSYVFIPGDDKLRVRFEIAKADNEKDNIKEANGKQRFFVLSKDFIAEEKNQLIVRFEHRPLTEGEKKKHPQNGIRRQASINKETGQRIFVKLEKTKGDWQRLLSASCPTEADAERTLLDKHIAAYTTKNSFDYFIHKDLGGFLRRELDFYIKSEVISVDNLQLADDPEVFMRNMAQVKAVKNVGEKIIDFLAQLENFQKQLWLKKKFVLETQYCVTLDKVPESLYPAIAKNKAQRNEWVKLFAIDELKGARTDGPTAYSEPLKPEFLQENPYLVLDTRHFDQKFTDKLLAALSETGAIEEQMNGLLVHGENFQGLRLLRERYRGQVKCIYIDPPYNTDSSSILYKNSYKHSSWLSLMENRLAEAKTLMPASGILCCAIDDEEVWRLRNLMQVMFARELGVAPVRSTPAGRKSSGRFSPSHEYALFYGALNAIPGVLNKTQKELERYPFSDEIGRFAWNNLIRHGSNDKREDAPQMFYPIYVGLDDSIRVPKIEWDEGKQEYKTLEKPKADEVVVWPVREQDGKKIEKNWHRGWERVMKEPGEYRVRRNGNGDVSIDFRIRMDEEAMPKTWWSESKYSSANHGTKALKNVLPDSPFDFPKSVELVKDCLLASGANESDVNIVDFFAGSGTTGHAVINLNREDGGRRKFILMEVGKHFDDVLLPRMKKVAYSTKWKDGKPGDRNGISQLFKYVCLESYEDTLDSLAVKSRKDLFTEEESKGIAEDYQLRYALGEETAESASLVGQDFIDPFNYTLSVVRDGVRRDVNVDLAETFNFLLGLSLTSRRQMDGVLTIMGTTRKGENCLIFWRNLNKMDASQLDEWFAKHRETFGNNLNLIYVNGDHTLNAIRKSGDQWEAITTEPAFRQLMFSRAE